MTTATLRCALSLFAAGIAGSSTQAETLPEEIVFKTIGNRALHLFVEKPADWKPDGRHPAVVFFFGGGWVTGSPQQFQPQSEYLAARGVVGLRAEYRTIPKGDAGPPVLALQDAKSAIRHVRAHATELGIDPNRIAAAGGSAGGHLAAATALLPGFDDLNDPPGISPRPNALLLFNAVIDNGPGEWGHGRVGARYKEFSPAHHVTAEAPPTIVFLGDRDHLLPVATVERFAAAMKKAGARCETHIYPGAGHGFFNKRGNDTRYFDETMAATDAFLASLGWLSPKAGQDSPAQGAPTPQ